MEGWSERTQGQAKLIQLHRYQESQILNALTLCLKSFLCCPRPPSHHPSSLTLVSLVPALHFLPLSTPFWPYSTHPFFEHAQTISILSDLLHSLIPFYSSSPSHPFIPNTSIRDTAIKLLKHFILRTFTLLLSAT